MTEILRFAQNDRPGEGFVYSKQQLVQLMLFGLQSLVRRYFACHRFEHAPDVFSKDLLAGCIWMNVVGQIQ